MPAGRGPERGGRGHRGGPEDVCEGGSGLSKPLADSKYRYSGFRLTPWRGPYSPDRTRRGPYSLGSQDRTGQRLGSLGLVRREACSWSDVAASGGGIARLPRGSAGVPQFAECQGGGVARGPRVVVHEGVEGRRRRGVARPALACPGATPCARSTAPEGPRCQVARAGAAEPRPGACRAMPRGWPAPWSGGRRSRTATRPGRRRRVGAVRISTRSRKRECCHIPRVRGKDTLPPSNVPGGRTSCQADGRTPDRSIGQPGLVVVW